MDDSGTVRPSNDIYIYGATLYGMVGSHHSSHLKVENGSPLACTRKDGTIRAEEVQEEDALQILPGQSGRRPT